MNMKVSVQRLKDFGIFGYAKHLSKSCCVYLMMVHLHGGMKEVFSSNI